MVSATPLSSGVGGSGGVVNYTPHGLAPHLSYNFESKTMFYTNINYRMISITVGDDHHTDQVIRDVWSFCTKRMRGRSRNTSMMFKCNGQKVEMQYASGFKIRFRGADNWSDWVLIGARPITVHHLQHCILGKSGMSEAVAEIRMTKKSMKSWNRDFWK